MSRTSEMDINNPDVEHQSVKQANLLKCSVKQANLLKFIRLHVNCGKSAHSSLNLNFGKSSARSGDSRVAEQRQQRGSISELCIIVEIGELLVLKYKMITPSWISVQPKRIAAGPQLIEWKGLFMFNPYSWWSDWISFALMNSQFKTKNLWMMRDSRLLLTWSLFNFPVSI